MATIGIVIDLLLGSDTKPFNKVCLIALPTSAPLFLCFEKNKIHPLFTQVNYRTRFYQEIGKLLTNFT